MPTVPWWSMVSITSSVRRRRQGVGDLPRVGHRAGQPIELGHDQRVASADGREGLIQAGPGARGAGQAAIHIDPLRCDPEGLEHGLLDGEILLVG